MDQYNLLPPLQVIQILSQNASVTLSVVKDYISSRMLAEDKQIVEVRSASKCTGLGNGPGLEEDMGLGRGRGARARAGRERKVSWSRDRRAQHSRHMSSLALAPYVFASTRAICLR